jgi:hypothetical protein
MREHRRLEFRRSLVTWALFRLGVVGPLAVRVARPRKMGVWLPRVAISLVELAESYPGLFTFDPSGRRAVGWASARVVAEVLNLN